ncbi:MAG: putative baseplate assembly protein [Spirochaetia bacterium]|jgi:hypothetical protein|nr:putative baseplate assembly protein [Spirochaetia bacterium]
MILKNSLDDRSFADIVEEALRLIPRYCPEWTNHNPADPGVTLVELFAWMTEMTLYRLNRVPEKTYLALLELLGLYPVPPQAARAVVCFYPTAGCKKPVLLREGRKIAAVSGGAEGDLVFETERDLLVAPNGLAACVNRCGEFWADYCTAEGFSGFPLFEAHDTVEHVLYLASPSFAYLRGGHAVEISFHAAEEILCVQDEAVNYFYWEYWDGRAWAHIGASRCGDNVLRLRGPVELEACGVNGREAFWLRAVLSDVPKSLRALRVRGISLRTRFAGQGFAPELCLVNTGPQYSAVDMNGVFRIFSESPSLNEVFYLAEDGIFSRPGLKVCVVFTLSEIYVPGQENEDARFAWEYWDGNSWAGLDAGEDAGLSGFRDGTYGFRQGGEVCFVVPEKIGRTAVNNEERFWIRVRLLAKDFSLGGEYVRDEKDNWVWRFSSKVHSPLFSRIRIGFDAGTEAPQEIFSCTNFHWNDLRPLLCAAGEAPGEAVLFDLAQASPPRLYLGFREAFPPGDAALYIRLRDGGPAARRESVSGLLEGFSGGAFAAEDGEGAGREGARPITLEWEFWDGSRWAGLAVNDYTDCFHESGFVEFSAPADMARKKEFGKNLYWLRLGFVSGSFEARPFVQAVLLNAVYARNSVGYTNEIAGSGTGGPGQRVLPAHGPLLPGLVLYVGEGSIPPAKEIDAMRAEGTREPYYEEAGEVWVRYLEVPNFYASGPMSRHFVVDYGGGAVLFGDGRRGINPPCGKFNIRLASYNAGGGEAGNAAPGTLRVLAENIPFVSGCDNPFPAEGGAGRESVDSLKARAAGILKSRGRAVTAGDFEWLAREASSSVGRAFCLKEKNRLGEIRVALVPAAPAGEDLRGRLVPSRELLRRVQAYLEERKLVGTGIRLQGPVYHRFSIFLTVTAAAGVLDRERLKRSIEVSLRKAFHPLWGGTGAGWDFGKAVSAGVCLSSLKKPRAFFRWTRRRFLIVTQALLSKN